mmetsp:Transcript_4572/g.8230  ORF Transcript_4572/g.8230 Transcript_4572/m.8230 type:complete len:1534 (-) Transcript_4572:663-5264(-)
MAQVSMSSPHEEVVYTVSCARCACLNEGYQSMAARRVQVRLLARYNKDVREGVVCTTCALMDAAGTQQPSHVGKQSDRSPLDTFLEWQEDRFSMALIETLVQAHKARREVLKVLEQPNIDGSGQTKAPSVEHSPKHARDESAPAPCKRPRHDATAINLMPPPSPLVPWQRPHSMVPSPTSPQVQTPASALIPPVEIFVPDTPPTTEEPELSRQLFSASMVTIGAVAETQFDESLPDEAALSPKDFVDSAIKVTDLLPGGTAVNQACRDQLRVPGQECHGSTEGPRTPDSDESSETDKTVELLRSSVSLQPDVAAETPTTTPEAGPHTPNNVASCDPSAPCITSTLSSAVKQSPLEGQNIIAECSAALFDPSNDALPTTRLQLPAHSDIGTSRSLTPTETPTLSALHQLPHEGHSFGAQTHGMEALGNAAHVAVDTEDGRIVHREDVGPHANSTMRITDPIPSSSKSEAQPIQCAPGPQPSSPTPPLLPLPHNQHYSSGQQCQQFLEPTGALIGHSGTPDCEDETQLYIAGPSQDMMTDIDELTEPQVNKDDCSVQHVGSLAGDGDMLGIRQDDQFCVYGAADPQTQTRTTPAAIPTPPLPPVKSTVLSATTTATPSSAHTLTPSLFGGLSGEDVPNACPERVSPKNLMTMHHNDPSTPQPDPDTGPYCCPLDSCPSFEPSPKSRYECSPSRSSCDAPVDLECLQPGRNQTPTEDPNPNPGLHPCLEDSLSPVLQDHDHSSGCRPEQEMVNSHPSSQDLLSEHHLPPPASCHNTNQHSDPDCDPHVDPSVTSGLGCRADLGESQRCTPEVIGPPGCATTFAPGVASQAGGASRPTASLNASKGGRLFLSQERSSSTACAGSLLEHRKASTGKLSFEHRGEPSRTSDGPQSMSVSPHRSHSNPAADTSTKCASSPNPTQPCSTKTSPVSASSTSVDDIQDFDSYPMVEDLAKDGSVGCAGVEVGAGPGVGSGHNAGTSGTFPRTSSHTCTHAAIPSRTLGAFYQTPNPSPKSSPAGRHPNPDQGAPNARASSLLLTKPPTQHLQPFTPQTATQNIPHPEVSPFRVPDPRAFPVPLVSRHNPVEMTSDPRSVGAPALQPSPHGGTNSGCPGDIQTTSCSSSVHTSWSATSSGSCFTAESSETTQSPFAFINRDHPIILHSSPKLPVAQPILHVAWGCGRDIILGVSTKHHVTLFRQRSAEWEVYGRVTVDANQREEVFRFCFDSQGQVLIVCAVLQDTRFGTPPTRESSTPSLTSSTRLYLVAYSLAHPFENALDMQPKTWTSRLHRQPVNDLLCGSGGTVFTAGQDGIVNKLTFNPTWSTIKEKTVLQPTHNGEGKQKDPIRSITLPETHFATLLIGTIERQGVAHLAVWNHSTRSLLKVLPCNGLSRLLSILPEQAYKQQTPNDYNNLTLLGLVKDPDGRQRCAMHHLSAEDVCEGRVYTFEHQEHQDLGSKDCMAVTFNCSSNSNKYLALGTESGKVALHNLNTGRCVGILCDLAGNSPEASNLCTAVAFHPKDPYFATCGGNGVIHVYTQPP